MKIIFGLILFSLSLFAHSQRNSPIIKATSRQVDIRDEQGLHKGSWTISPNLNPDIYTTSAKNKRVTFYTDIDSLSIKVKSNTKYDFTILLYDSIEAHTQIKYVPSYLETLRNAKQYNSLKESNIPDFTYQQNDNPNLIALKKQYNLDSIAGAGNETSRIINLMHWVHNILPHDGVKELPNVRNAMNLIDICKTENRGVSCLGLSIILNECYLAMGIKSRSITCLPKDTTDFDCHVINMVYSTEQNKWLWIDPTNDAYVMDETGELLSIEEVRQRLVNGKPLILNPDANWNHKKSTLKNEYLYSYMAKNLYKFQCPINSEYDIQTAIKGKETAYIQLLPLDYGMKLEKTELKNSKTETTYIIFKTNNPDMFWKKP